MEHSDKIARARSVTGVLPLVDCSNWRTSFHVGPPPKPLGVYVTVLAAGFTNTAVLEKFGLDPQTMPMKPMSVEQCVSEGLSGLLKNRSRIVPGRLNRIMNALVPASSARKMEADMIDKGACQQVRCCNCSRRGLITDGRLVEPFEPCESESVSLGDESNDLTHNAVWLGKKSRLSGPILRVAKVAHADANQAKPLVRSEAMQLRIVHRHWRAIKPIG